MPNGGAADDVKIRVRLDTQEAERGIGRVENRFASFAKKSAKQLARRAGQVGFGVLGSVAAGLVGPTTAGLFEIGRGVTSVLGRQFFRSTGLEQTAGNISADVRAQEQLLQATGGGLAATGLSDQQLQRMFSALQRVERTRERGRQRVFQATDIQIGDIGEKLVSAVTMFSSAVKAFEGLITTLKLR